VAPIIRVTIKIIIAIIIAIIVNTKPIKTIFDGRDQLLNCTFVGTNFTIFSSDRLIYSFSIITKSKKFTLFKYTSHEKELGILETNEFEYVIILL
jgi:hypothetical protein